MLGDKRKIKFIMEDECNYVDALQKIEFVVGGSSDLHEMVENFRSFLLALGYGPDAVSKYLDPDYEPPKEECCGMCNEDQFEMFEYPERNEEDNEFDYNYQDDLQEFIDDMGAIEPIELVTDELNEGEKNGC